MRGLMVAAAFVIVVAGMKAARALLAPFLLALFIAIAVLPAMLWLRRHGVPIPAAITVIATALLGALSGLGVAIGRAAADLSRKLPQYEAGLRAQLDHFLGVLASWGIVADPQMLRDQFDPAAALSFVAQALTGLGGVLASAFMIVLTVVFLLFEFASLPHKWAHMGEHAPDRARVERALSGIHSYLVVKTLVSLATGLLAALLLWAVGVDYAMLWGIVAFLLNFVPNIGSFIAAAPPVLLAWVALSGWHALVVAAGYLVINLVIGNFIEPRLMGREVGLSTLVVFLSMVFWGWVLGPVGMLLSAPLTMIVRLALEADARTRWVAVLIGPDLPPKG
ncbi:MAG: AI-2E family transporter [Zetaproteobacteria bacterium]|nr:MAG: AI-2E family transporter [Zetaproteobacteria bacterium]